MSKFQIDTAAADIVIISRHAGFVALLGEMGITGPVVAHATAEDVRGKLVVGALPLHLACLARAIGTLEMNVPQHMRGIDLTVEECRILTKGKEVEWFVVRSFEGQQRLLDDATDSGWQGCGGVLATKLAEEVRD